MTDHDRERRPFEPDLRAADDLAAAAMRENVEAPPVSHEPSAPARRRVGPIVAAACLVVVASQLPTLRVSFKSPPSIRVGATSTDADADACIDTLWRISALLQYGSFRGREIVEPVTRQPYVVRHVDGDTIVECPNPAAHGLRSLWVSAAHRAPEAEQ